MPQYKAPLRDTLFIL
ncbi:MAG: acyl-CoA dehydrogenase N-terminal domain-containing protein, partial [Pseudomonadota bacterium]